MSLLCSVLSKGKDVGLVYGIGLTALRMVVRLMSSSGLHLESGSCHLGGSHEASELT